MAAAHVLTHRQRGAGKRKNYTHYLDRGLVEDRLYGLIDGNRYVSKGHIVEQAILEFVERQESQQENDA